MKALTDASCWSELLAFAEEETANYPFWLTLHRIVAQAMDRLGILFFDARASVGREAVDFFGRFRTVTRLTFANGQPFADAETKEWLQAERARHSPSATHVVSDGDKGDQTARLEMARAMVTKGEHAEGLQLAVHTARHSSDARARFVAYTEVIELALMAKKPEIYAPHLPLLMAEVDRVRLDEWEPDLCARFLYAFLACKKVGGWTTASAPNDEVFLKLCRIDPSLALKLAEVV